MGSLRGWFVMLIAECHMEQTFIRLLFCVYNDSAEHAVLSHQLRSLCKVAYC